MGLPDARCSLPSASMISVPEAGCPPRGAHRVLSSKASRIVWGSPWGKVGNGSDTISPIISQWPVRVSLPREASCMTPKCAAGLGSLTEPFLSAILPSPSRSRQGRGSPPTFSEQWRRLFAPSSPYAAASGRAPMPTPSMMTRKTRLMSLSLGACKEKGLTRGEPFWVGRVSEPVLTEPRPGSYGPRSSRSQPWP